MKKFYKILFFLIIFIFLSTYNPNKTNKTEEKQNTFFIIKNIEVENNLLIKTKDIKEKLKNVYNRNIFFLKSDEILTPLKEIDFLNKIEVKKKYPNTILIKIFETKPVAIFFKGKSKYILDDNSNIILYEQDLNNNQLPSIFGDGAKDNFMIFLQKLKENNFPKERIKNYYFFQSGRWDIELIDNKIIKFPYNKTNGAIKKSIELLNRNDFKKYNIIDLRVDGKIIVE